MSSYFNCAAFDDVNVSIRLDDNVVFLALKVEDKNADMHITLNPFQVRTLAKYLSVALTKINFADLLVEKHFGDLTVEIKQDNLHEDFDEEEYALAVPF
ncbi:MAG: hypothetical protein IJK81_04230 [Selenomonadaceae bacterium]|nr:hypothetical protein [Selenomonadaceae bacterium]